LRQYRERARGTIGVTAAITFLVLCRCYRRYTARAPANIRLLPEIMLWQVIE